MSSTLRPDRRVRRCCVASSSVPLGSAARGLCRSTAPGAISASISWTTSASKAALKPPSWPPSRPPLGRLAGRRPIVHRPASRPPRACGTAGPPLHGDEAHRRGRLGCVATAYAPSRPARRGSRGHAAPRADRRMHSLACCTAGTGWTTSRGASAEARRVGERGHGQQQARRHVRARGFLLCATIVQRDA